MTRRQLALVAVVVVWWSKDLDAVFIMFKMLYILLVNSSNKFGYFRQICFASCTVQLNYARMLCNKGGWTERAHMPAAYSERNIHLAG
jgi:hypothetical protein